MPKLTTEDERAIARAWLEKQLRIDPQLKLPIKIPRIKTNKRNETVGVIPTEHSFFAAPHPTKEGEFILAPIPRKYEEKGMLGKGTSAFAVKLLDWGPDFARSKISLIPNNEKEAEHISIVTGDIDGTGDNRYQTQGNVLHRQSSRIIEQGYSGDLVIVRTMSSVLQPYLNGITLKRFFENAQVSQLEISKLPSGASADMYYKAGEITQLRILGLALACTKALRDLEEKGYSHGAINATNIIVNENDGMITAGMIDRGHNTKISHEASSSGIEAMKSDIRALGLLFSTFMLTKLPKPERPTEFEELSKEMITTPEKYSFDYDSIMQKLKELILQRLTLKLIKETLGEKKFREVLDKTAKSAQQATQHEYSYPYLLEKALVSAYADKIGIDISGMGENLFYTCDKLSNDFGEALSKGQESIEIINDAIYKAAISKANSPHI